MKEKRSYTHWGTTYVSITGLPTARTVSIKNESDKFIKELLKYDIFPKKTHSKGTADLQTGPVTSGQVACTKYVGNAPHVLENSIGKVASVTSTFPISLFQCPRLLSYQGPPALHDDLVRMVRSCHICYVDKPLDDNMMCEAHPDGCGKALEVHDIVVCDASECELVEGKIYYIAARMVVTIEDNGKVDTRKGCKVGIIKCLFNQLHLFAHRVGLVVSIERQDEVKTLTQNMRNHCCTVAKLSFLDGGSLLNFG